MRRSSLKSRSGFALVDLLVVIAIIGILAGLLLNGLGRNVPLVPSAALTQLNSELENSLGFVIAIPLLLALLIYDPDSGPQFNSFRDMVGKVPIPHHLIGVDTRNGRSRLSLLIDHVVRSSSFDRISREEILFLSTYSLKLDEYILLREDVLASRIELLVLANKQLQDYVKVIAILRSGNYVE